MTRISIWAEKLWVRSGFGLGVKAMEVELLVDAHGYFLFGACLLVPWRDRILPVNHIGTENSMI